MIRATFFFVFLIHQLVGAQQLTILDAESNQPIANVAVFNQDRSKTALSDLAGKCDLANFDKNERLTISHIGYEVRRATLAQILEWKGKIYLTVKPQQLDEVVMSISKWEQQKKDIPNKIATINAQEIAFTNPQTAADLLMNSGKIFVQKSQLGGGSPMIRGFSTNRLLISVDGVRMNNAIFRGGNIQNIISIDPFTVKNTEVIFGPGSVIYGSDAIGGVMNFYTKKALFSTTDSLLALGNANYRFSTANSENSFHVDINLGKKLWAFLTSASYNNFGDLSMGSHGPDSYLRNVHVIRRNGQDVLVANEKPKKQVPTGYDQVNLLQKIGFRPNNILGIELGLHYSETSDYSRYDRLVRPNGAGDGLRSAEWFYGPQKWFLGNLQINKKGKGKFYDGVKITTAYQHFEESRHDRDFQDGIRNSTKEKVGAFSSNIDFENKRMGDLRLYYGSEFVFNSVGSFGSQTSIANGSLSKAPTRYPNGALWQTLAGYLNAEYKTKPNMTLMAGLRYSHVWIDADFDRTFYPFPFDRAKLNNGALTGSMGMSWLPKNNLQITLNGSTGFRSPNIDDIGKVFESEPGAVVVPNLDLEPEYGYNVELGIKKNFNDKMVFTGATFYTYLVDALVRRDFQFNGLDEIEYNGEPSRVQAIQNAAKAYVYGVEFGLEAFLGEHFTLQTNLTFTEGVEEEADGTDSPGRHVAPTFGDIHLIYKNPKLKADFFLNYNGEIPFDGLAASERSKAYIYAIDQDGNPYSPSWYTLNLRSQYLLSAKLKTTLALENISDQRYRSYSSGIVSPGANLVMGLAYTF